MHLLKNRGIEVVFSDSEEDLHNVLKRVIDPSLRVALIDQSVYRNNYCPFSNMLNVVRRTFKARGGDGKKWNEKYFSLFSELGVFTTSVKDIKEEILNYVNCKRFAQVFAKEFAMELDSKFEDRLKELYREKYGKNENNSNGGNTNRVNYMGNNRNV